MPGERKSTEATEEKQEREAELESNELPF
jgi:hypothetical protein